MKLCDYPKLATTLLLLIFGALLLALLGTPVHGRLDVEGYVEPALGVRYDNEGPIEQRNVLEENRIMLENRWYGAAGSQATLRGLIKHEGRENAEVELREGSLMVPLGHRYDLTVGRQTLSWGPARYEFVNDRFAKDYRSFFLGRDLEYLKAPNDALRLAGYLDHFNFDLALMPRFEHDRTARGLNLPVYHPGEGELRSAGDTLPGVARPEDDISDGEVHLRVHRNFGRWETALYGYRGFTGTPRAVRTVGSDSEVYHPQMAAGGFSLRGPLFGSIVWLEGAYEDIRAEDAGSNPNLPSDQYQFMAGLEYQTQPTVTYMLQGTWLIDDDASQARRQAENDLDDDHPATERDKYRLQVATTREYWDDRLVVEARGLFGITEEDYNLRLQANYEWSDSINIYAGTLHFDGEYEDTRFGALEENDLFYSRLRYSF